MNTQMRNKQTGEIKDVERDSSEFRDLQSKVDGGGYPLWEQTSYAHADAVKARAEAGELDDNDVGAEHAEQLQHAAVLLDQQGVAAEANPHLQLTPGEIEAGMTPQSKLDGLRDMYAPDSAPANRESVLDDAAKVIAGDKAGKSGRAAAQAKGMRARAGGSDERSGVPVAAHADDPDTEASPPAKAKDKPAEGSGS